MKVLLDKHCEGMKKYLTSKGWEVITVTEKGLERDDKKIVEYAKEKNLLFVTENKDAAGLADLERTKFIHLNDVLKAEIVNIRLRERNIKPNSENT